MSDEDSPPLPPGAGLEARVARAKLRLIIEQAPRVRISMLLMDLYILWLLAEIGQVVAATILIVAHQAMHLWRWSIPKRYLRVGGDPRRVERRLEIATALIGLERGLIAFPLFSVPVTITHYICTTVLVGQLAGATGSMAGLTRGFTLWAIALCVPTASAWIVQGTGLTTPVGLLMLLLLFALVAVVRESSATLHKTMRLEREAGIDRDRATEAGRQAEIERDRANDASLAKTYFFSAANHDLRQPLQALRYQVGHLQSLAQNMPGDQWRKVTGALERSLDDGEKLLEGLLDISRLEAGAMPAHVVSLNAHSLLRAVSAQYEAASAASGLALEVQAEGDMLWVLGDRDHLLRILANLVGNAFKFTSRGRVRVTAWKETGPGTPRLAIAGSRGLDPTAGNPRVVFAVSDTGLGIPAESLPRVFQEFYQVGNDARQRSKGSGLGLSIVQRLVDQLGGAVSVTSTPGEGTRFEVALPAATSPPEGTEAVAAPGEEPVLLRLDARVLAVDDDDALLVSLEGLLRSLGGQVRTATSGAEALAIVDQGFLPEILLLDHRLHQETGLQVLARLRERIGSVPAIVLTGDTTPELVQGAQEGCFHVQYKPVNPARLLALIRATVDVERESELDTD